MLSLKLNLKYRKATKARIRNFLVCQKVNLHIKRHILFMLIRLMRRRRIKYSFMNNHFLS